MYAEIAQKIVPQLCRRVFAKGYNAEGWERGDSLRD